MTVPRHPSGGERGPRRIVLLVEDEPFVRDATCRILQSVGFDVLATANAQEAMEVYEQHGRRIDLLMADIVLPGRNGLQLSHELRQKSPAIPVLLTSGYVESERDTESREPQTYYLPKPYSRADLLEKMEKIFRLPRRSAATHAS